MPSPKDTNEVLQNIPTTLRVVGSAEHTADFSGAAMALPSLPSDGSARFALIQAKGGNLRWRSSGNPTSTRGFLLTDGNERFFNLSRLGDIRVIATSAATDLEVEYYA